MKEILIIGANEPGYELLEIIKSINNVKKEYKFIGFFDDHKKGINIFNDIGEIDEDVFFINSIGNIKDRIRTTSILIEKGFKLINAISPYSYISPSAKLGVGIVIYPGSVVSHDCIIGNNTLINYNSTISHGCVIGDNNNIAPGVNIAGNVTIGNNCFIGIGSAIIEKIKISDNIYIGANSTIINNLKKEGIYVGSPCKFLGKGKK